MKKIWVLFLGLSLVIGVTTTVNAETSVADKGAQLLLGEKLYHDTSLSMNGNQSCATCHNSSGSFVDDRDPDPAMIAAGWPASVPPPVSQGSDPSLFGGRNTPSSAYAAFSPAFRFDEVAGLYVGGQFWDGREMSLAGQAAGPFRNPVEMAMADKKAVVRILKWNREYRKLFARAYQTEEGKPFYLLLVSTFLNQHVLEAYDLMTQAIGEFEKTQRFNKFNSKYDYFLARDEPLTDTELQGFKLFENEGKCGLCHISQPGIAPDEGDMPPLFTDFTYDNLGIPKNPVVENLLGPQEDDLGLGGVLGDPSQDGKFKVMGLRNIELTAPYGHNGFFPTLASIVHFYNTRDVYPCWKIGGTPVTPADLAAGDLPQEGNGFCWPDEEVNDNMNTGELGSLGLSAAQEGKIVAFLKTLTDRDLNSFASVFEAPGFPPMP